MSSSTKRRSQKIALGIAFGVAIGAAIGAATDNIGVWMVIDRSKSDRDE